MASSTLAARPTILTCELSSLAADHRSGPLNTLTVLVVLCLLYL
jgi:hypothetical protein